MPQNDIGHEIADVKSQLAQARPSASTMNFVVWLDDPTFRDKVIERATKIGEKHPSRTFLFDATRTSGTNVSTSERSITDDASTVQGALVEIGVSPDDVARLCEMMSGLLASELPTVLWWTGSRISNAPAFDALIDCGVEAVVVDSSGTGSDTGAVHDLVSFPARHRGVAFHDLAYMRLAPWQETVARFFDDPDLRSELFAIRSLRIRSGSDAEAYYLGGWLASRLGWSARGDAFTDREGHQIAFERTRAGRIRRVHAVAIQTATTTYAVELTDDPLVARMWSEGTHAHEPHLVPLGPIDNASLTERAILDQSTDEIFETALRSVGALLGA